MPMIMDRAYHGYIIHPITKKHAFTINWKWNHFCCWPFVSNILRDGGFRATKENINSLLWSLALFARCSDLIET